MLSGTAVATDRDVGRPLAVEVGAAGHQETVLFRDLPVPGDIGRGVLGMPDLDPVEAPAHPRGDQVIPVEGSGMRECYHAARVADDSGRFLERHRLLRNIGGSVVTQEPLEGFVERVDVTPAHERFRHVRPAERAALRDLLHLVQA